MKKTVVKKLSKQYKVLLVNAINDDIEVETRYPNLGLAYLVAMVREYLPEKKIDFKIVDHNVYEVATVYKPDLVGITSVSQNFNIAKDYAKYFKIRNIQVILGGIHITLLPQTLPKTCVAACLGEGEFTFVEIIKAFIEDGRLTTKALSKIAGLVYWDEGKVCKTGIRRMEMKLDRIPLPARDLLPIGKHSYMFTSRGCPYRCTFCASSRFWDKLRFFSADYVVREIERLVNDHKTEMISFFDDLFVADRNRLKEILTLLRKKNLIGKVKFTCSCRANLVDEELVEILSEMRVVSVGMGLESGNEKVLRYLKGGTVSVKHNYKAIKLLKEGGIAANGSFVIGSPLETEKQIMDTYNFIKRSNLDLFDIYLLTPYPGTPVWEYAKEKKIVGEESDFDWSRLNLNTYNMSEDKIIILSETLSKKKLSDYYKKFRRLRLYHNVTRVIRHPMAKDVPKMAIKIIGEFLSRKIRRKKYYRLS